MAIDARRRVRRDRHGRGMRGPMLPHRAPAHRTRAELFLDEVAQAVADLDSRLGSRLRGIEFTVDEVPTVREAYTPNAPVPLGRVELGTVRLICLYRRPIELRANGEDMLERLIRDVLAEQVATVLGLPVLEVDPDYLGPQ